MKISRSKVKSVCTAAELELVDLSGPKNILTLSATQLRQKVSRARKLRDKWRDQSHSQRRTAQSTTGREASAANSATKAELFAEVLRRFESQLSKAEGSAGSAPGKKSSRKVRSKKHRATRAAVRDELTQARLEMAAKKRARRTAK